MRPEYILIIVVIIVATILLLKNRQNTVGNKPLDTSQLAQEYYEVGLTYLQDKKYEDAVEALGKSLDLHESEEVRIAYNKAMGFIGPM